MSDKFDRLEFETEEAMIAAFSSYFMGELLRYYFERGVLDFSWVSEFIRWEDGLEPVIADIARVWVSQLKDREVFEQYLAVSTFSVSPYWLAPEFRAELEVSEVADHAQRYFQVYTQWRSGGEVGESEVTEAFKGVLPYLRSKASDHLKLYYTQRWMRVLRGTETLVPDFLLPDALFAVGQDFISGLTEFVDWDGLQKDFVGMYAKRGGTDWDRLIEDLGYRAEDAEKGRVILVREKTWQEIKETP